MGSWVPPSTTPLLSVSGDPVSRIRFDGATCRACPARRMCTAAKDAPRPLTVRTQAHHEAIQAARQRLETAEFKAQDALRAGGESSLSQGVRRFDLRRSRYLGLARTHLQQLLTATAMNVVRVIAWLRGETLGERRRPLGHFARLSPHPLSRQTVLCYGRTSPTESVVASFGLTERLQGTLVFTHDHGTCVTLRFPV
jgi:transposase